MNLVTRGLGGRGLVTAGLGKQLAAGLGAQRQKGASTGQRFSNGYIIHVDDEWIWAATLKEALAILAQVEEVAEELAERIERTTTPLRIVPKITVELASGRPTQSKQIASSLSRIRSRVNDIIQQANEAALVNREIAQLIQKAPDPEDESAIIALLL